MKKFYIKSSVPKHGPTPPKPDSNSSRKKAQLTSEGRRFIDFVISIELWDRFKLACCDGRKPSEILIELIALAVAEAEKK